MYDITNPNDRDKVGHALLALQEQSLRIKRFNRRTQRDEPLGEVKMTFRRKTGQWLVSVGKFSSARPDVVEAMYDVVDRIHNDS